MKFRILSGVICLIMIQSAFSQIVTSNYSVKGIVIDSATQKPADLVTVSLKNSAKQTIKTAVTKSDGSFLLEKLAGGKYALTVISVGYGLKTISVDLSSNTKQETDLGTILISPVQTQLSTVSITADKPLIKQEIDRISYDLQADPESKVNTVLEMMRKVPLLSVDGEDNILLKGNASYKILINGKQSSMMERNAKDILRSMSASTIQNIEVITNPPSKYDSEGLAGIINIITVKKIDNGYNGSINMSERFPTGGPSAGSSFTFKQGKFGMSANGGLSLFMSPLAQTSNSRITTGASSTNLSQNGSRESENRNGYLNTELSYEIDSLNLISGQFNINGSRINGSNNQISQLNAGSSILQKYNLAGSNTAKGKGIDAALNYQLGFKRSKNRLLTFSYRYLRSENEQFNNLDVSNTVNYLNPDYNQTNEGSSSEQTFQADYTYPAKKLNIEAGIKGILRTNKSDFQYFSHNSSTGKFELDPNRTNKYNNEQNVFAAYNTYSYTLKTLGIKAGIRIEQTIVDADFISTASQVKQNYFNVIPSVSINKKYKNMSSLSLSYSQRIQRPGIYQLNPFVDRSNPTLESTGNPDLKPALTNTIGLGFNRTKKASVNLTVQYMFFNNLIGPVSAYNSVTNITRSTFSNTGKVKLAGFNLYVNYPVTKKLSLTFNTDARYGWINVIVNNSLVKNEGLMMYTNLSGGYRFEKGWRLNASLTMNSPNISSPQGKSNGYTLSSFTVNKDIVKDKLAFSSFVNNPFNKYRQNRDKRLGPDFTQLSDNQNYFRAFGFSLNYRFGKLKEAIKKNSRGIRNDDISNSTSGM